MPYYAPGTGFTNLDRYRELNRGTAEAMAQRAAQGVQRAGSASAAQLADFQRRFAQMLAAAQGQPATPGGPGAASGPAGPPPPPASLSPAGPSGGSGRGPFGGGRPQQNLVAGAPSYSPPGLQREEDLYGAFANTDPSKITADSLSGQEGYQDALGAAKQAAIKARLLGAGQGGLGVLLGEQAGPGYYGGRGRAIDAYSASTSGDLDPVSAAWRDLAEKWTSADVASAGQTADLRRGRQNYLSSRPTTPATATSPAPTYTPPTPEEQRTARPARPGLAPSRRPSYGVRRLM